MLLWTPGRQQIQGVLHCQLCLPEHLYRAGSAEAAPASWGLEMDGEEGREARFDISHGNLNTKMKMSLGHQPAVPH